MLQLLRRGVSSLLAKILFGVLVLSFAIWGVGDIFVPSTVGKAVATVGGIPVSQRDLALTLERQESVLRQQGLDPQVVRALGLEQQALDDLINRALYEAEAKALRITVSTASVAQHIRDNPAFRDGNGVFDRKRYEAALANAGATSSYYEAQLKSELTAQLLREAVGSGVIAPTALRDALIAWQKETRDAQALTLVPDFEAAARLTPDDATLAAFHTAQAAAFQTPEYRAVTFTAIDARTLAKTIAVPEQRLREAYDSAQDRFVTPERRGFDYQLFADEDAARTAYAKAVSGGGLDGASLTRTAPTPKAAIADPAVAETVFALARTGAFSEPRQGMFGWFVTRLATIEPEHRILFPEVRESLRTEIAAQEAETSAWSLANDLEDRLAAGETLEAASAALDLPVRVIEAMDAAGHDASGTALASLPDESFAESVFATAPGDESPMQKDAHGEFYILRVDGVTASRSPALAEIRPQVLAAWRHAQAWNQARTRADAVTAALNTGADPAKTARDAGLPVRALNALTRNSAHRTAARDAPAPALVDAVFRTAVGQAAWVESGDTIQIAVVRRVRTPPASAQEQAAVQTALTQEMRSDLNAQLLKALREKHPITVDRSIFAAVVQSRSGGNAPLD